MVGLFAAGRASYRLKMTPKVSPGPEVTDSMIIQVSDSGVPTDCFTT